MTNPNPISRDEQKYTCAHCHKAHRVSDGFSCPELREISTSASRDELDEIFDQYYPVGKVVPNNKIDQSKADFMTHILEHRRNKFVAEIREYTAQKVQEAIDNETPVKICGKSIDEVVVILNSLELERIEDMKMTMANLDKWMERVREDHHQAMQKAIDRTFQTLKENR